MTALRIPVVDLFAGPGGLGEGFASLDNSFDVVASAEAGVWAHRTLRLRSMFRKLGRRGMDSELYQALIGASRSGDYSKFAPFIREAWTEAGQEALNLTIGKESDDALLRQHLDTHGLRNRQWILVGGPPCQAYSVVGRARNKGIAGYNPKQDGRHFLYKEYLKIIREYRPAIFVMENVKGILSSSVDGKRIFHQILTDLTEPDKAIGLAKSELTYSIHSVNVDKKPFQAGMEACDYDARGFTVYAERHGIPQRRHRVFLVGVRGDIALKLGHLQTTPERDVSFAIDDLPRLRSRLTKEPDGNKEWKTAIHQVGVSLTESAKRAGSNALASELGAALATVSKEELPTGVAASPSLFRYVDRTNRCHNDLSQWLAGSNLNFVLNHESKGHMRSDLARYLFAASFAKVHKRSPKGSKDFALEGLQPNHKNWRSGHFSDRFRVQVAKKPSTTVTSHLAKDGHYFIHPDPSQCRALTVREAARLQTFPDDYFFVGPRTQQYTQVGNAVPPFLARQIALILARGLNKR